MITGKGTQGAATGSRTRSTEDRMGSTSRTGSTAGLPRTTGW
ncbi:hypothetical protein ABN028_32815 [Actinopolymorpha sp. B17G11]